MVKPPKIEHSAEQLAKLVMGEFKGESQAVDFKDVTPDMWSYDAINKTNALFSHDGMYFYPEKDATREETALVITKAVFGDVLEKIKPSDTDFSDIDSIEEEKTVLISPQSQFLILRKIRLLHLLIMYSAMLLPFRCLMTVQPL